MASLGLPGLAGFWGEFPAILASYQPAAGLTEARVPRRTWSSPRSAPCSPPATCSGCYQRVAFGARGGVRASPTTSHDVTLPEWLAWTPLLVGIVVLGIFPNLIFHMTDDAVGSALRGVAG